MGVGFGRIGQYMSQAHLDAENKSNHFRVPAIRGQRDTGEASPSSRVVAPGTWISQSSLIKNTKLWALTLSCQLFLSLSQEDI